MASSSDLFAQSGVWGMQEIVEAGGRASHRPLEVPCFGWVWAMVDHQQLIKPQKVLGDFGDFALDRDTAPRQGKARAVGPSFERFRSKLFDVLLVLWTGLFAPAAVVLSVSGKPELAVRKTARAWARGTLGILNWSVGLTYREQGRTNIPAGPCLIVANHQSTWETIAFLALIPNVAIVAKDELLRIPVFGWFLRNAPMIIIDRDSGTRALRTMIEESRTALEGGRPVLIFPEGTRRSVSAKIEFKRGVEILYAKLGCKVLPVSLNSGHFWGPDLPNKRPGIISVDYLDVIEPELSRAEFIRRLQSSLEGSRRNASGHLHPA